MSVLLPEYKQTKHYLVESEFIDYSHPTIVELAQELAKQGEQSSDDFELCVAKLCFEFVRDEIKHSADYAIDIITCKASEVLEHRTGYCYAKSHLLAALLRANQIPAGLCYQRLSIIDDDNYASNSEEPYILHGLNALYLKSFGWYRVDARGNKPGVAAQFCPPIERLAFQLEDPNEVDFETIYLEPLPEVIAALNQHATVQTLNQSLPDILIAD